MSGLKTTRFVFSVLLAVTVLASMSAAQAQPMMADMALHHNETRMHERMAKHWEQRQAELKSQLHLSAAQEPAWQAFVQGVKRPAFPVVQPLDRESLAKLSTPERMEKMNALHEAHMTAMQGHIKQRTEATHVFYNQLTAEQQKVFDTQTLPHPSRWKGKRD